MPDIRLPNGYVIKGVPDGVSKQEVMERAIAKGFATAEDFPAMATPVSAAQPTASPPSSPAVERPSMFQRYLSTMRSIPETVSTAVQNVATLGQAPKLEAFEAAALGPETYEQALAREEAERTRVKQESPLLYGATQAAAPLALAPLTGGATLPFTGGRFVAQGLAIPAAEGAILGATQAAEEGQSMTQGATLGAAMGGLLGPVGHVIGSGIEKIARGAFRPNRKAERIIKETLDENMSPDDAIDRLRAGGEDYMIGDLIPEATYQVQATQGPARQRIRSALEQRQKGDVVTGAKGQKDKFRNIMNDFTGKYDENFYTNLRNLRTEQSETAKTLFNQAFENKVKPTDEFVALTKTPVGREAFNKAKSSYLNDLNLTEFPFQQRSQKQAQEAFSIANKQPEDTYSDYIKSIDDLKFWHKFKVSLDEMADYTDAGQRIFKKSDRTSKNRAASDIGGVVREELKYQSELYESALDTHRQFTQMDEGMRLGKNIYRMKTDEIEDMLNNVSLPKESIKLGMIQAVKEQVQNMVNTGSVGRKVTRNDNFKAVLKQVLPKKAEYAQFLKQMQRLEDQAYTFARVNQTVPTAENIKLIERAERAGSPIGDIIDLNIRQGIKRAAGNIGAPVLPREELADILLQQGPQAISTIQRLYSPQMPQGTLSGPFGLLGSGIGTQTMFQQ